MTGCTTQAESSVPTADGQAADLAIGHRWRAREASTRDAARDGARSGVFAGLANQLLSVVATLILARLLAPADFGLVAGAQTIIGFVAAITQIGVRASVIRRREIDQRAASTYFWAAVGLGAVFAAIVAGTSTLLARALGLPGAATLIAVLAISLVPQMAIGVPEGLLRRNFRFRPVYAMQVVAAGCYVVVQVVLATLGVGAMSVVIGQVVSVSVGFLGTMACARWFPSLRFRPSMLRAEIGYNVGLLGTAFTSYLGKNVDYWFVSRIAGAPALGVYYVAFVLPNILRQRITVVAGAIMFPVFARHQDDPERLRSAYVESFGLHLMAGVPAMCGLALVAKPVIAVFFGAKWAAAGTPLAILSLAAGAEFATQAATTVFDATGRMGRAMGLQLSRLVLLVAGLWVAYSSGRGLDPTTAAGAVLASTCVTAVLAQAMMRAILQVRARDLCSVVWTIAPPTAAMVAAIVAIHRLVDTQSNLAVLATQVVVGAGTFAAVGSALGGTRFRTLSTECLRVGLPTRFHRPLRLA